MNYKIEGSKYKKNALSGHREGEGDLRGTAREAMLLPLSYGFSIPTFTLMHLQAYKNG